MKSHIASACFFHLRRLRQLRSVVTEDVMKQLVMSVVLGRLDYCNSVLFSARASCIYSSNTSAPVKNVAARLVLQLDQRTPVKPALQRLHWLPVKALIEFKIATLMYAIHHQRGPALGISHSATSCNSTLQNLDAASFVPSRLMQLLL